MSALFERQNGIVLPDLALIKDSMKRRYLQGRQFLRIRRNLSLAKMPTCNLVRRSCLA